MREIVLDTETTGLDPRLGHRIVEVGCVEIINKISTGNTFHALINPERDVPEDAARVHGHTTEKLKDKPVFRDILSDFLNFLSDSTLVIHNAEFDLKFLNWELQMLEAPLISSDRAIDTVKMARRRFPGQPNNLDALCKRLGIDNRARTLHGALLDAKLLAEVYAELWGGSTLNLSDSAPPDVASEGGIEFRQGLSYRAPRAYVLPPEEASLHQEFLEKISDPLWLSAKKDSA